MNTRQPKGPNWQRRVRSMVDEALRSNDRIWGRQLSSFLFGQVELLEAAFGQTRRRIESTQRMRQAATIRAVGLVVKANPKWTVRDVADTLGISVGTAARYVKAARAKYHRA